MPPPSHLLPCEAIRPQSTYERARARRGSCKRTYGSTYTYAKYLGRERAAILSQPNQSYLTSAHPCRSIPSHCTQPHPHTIQSRPRLSPPTPLTQPHFDPPPATRRPPTLFGRVFPPDTTHSMKGPACGPHATARATKPITLVEISPKCSPIISSRSRCQDDGRRARRESLRKKQSRPLRQYRQQ